MNQENTETIDRRPYESIKDYAKKKGVSVHAIYKQVERQKLETKKIGAQIFVRPIL